MATAKARWSLRVSQPVDESVRAAAQASHENLTDFIARAASSEADRILSERTRFVLSEDDWDRFTTLLDRPAADNPGLRKLLDAPDPFS